MEFRLTYAGPLLGANGNNSRAQHKHEIRKKFHSQLKRYWDVHPYLKTARLHTAEGHRTALQLVDQLARRFERNGYNFVPLVTEDLKLICSIEILCLRPDGPSGVIRSGDLDNRLKTVFDSLRIPSDSNELGGYAPADDEAPFFCLLEDDKLISHASVETDLLLEPISGDTTDPNDVRLMISVKLRPYVPFGGNYGFG